MGFESSVTLDQRTHRRGTRTGGKEILWDRKTYLATPIDVFMAPLEAHLTLGPGEFSTVLELAIRPGRLARKPCVGPA